MMALAEKWYHAWTPPYSPLLHCARGLFGGCEVPTCLFSLFPWRLVTLGNDLHWDVALERYGDG